MFSGQLHWKCQSARPWNHELAWLWYICNTTEDKSCEKNLHGLCVCVCSSCRSMCPRKKRKKTLHCLLETSEWWWQSNALQLFVIISISNIWWQSNAYQLFVIIFISNVTVSCIVLSILFIVLTLRLHSHRHECESGYPCVGHSKHKYACIPIAAIYIDTSFVGVWFALLRVVSAWVLFLGNPFVVF